MKTETLKMIAQMLGLLLAVFGVVCYRELPVGWNILMWIPITIGYSLYFGRWLR